MNATPFSDRLLFMLEAPYVKSYHKVWQRRLAAICNGLHDCLLTREDIAELVNFLKAQAEQMKNCAEGKAAIDGPDWAHYSRYGYGCAISIGGDLSVMFRGCAKIPGDTVHHYLFDLDLDKLYKTASK